MNGLEQRRMMAIELQQETAKSSEAGTEAGDVIVTDNLWKTYFM